MIEVLGQLEPEPARGSAGDVGVGREIGVNLNREREHPRPQQRKRRVPEREHLVGDYSDVVGDHQLLEEPPADQTEAAPGLLHREAARRLDLWQQERGALDWSGNQVREERHERGKVEQVPARVELSLVHVDGVTHRLERVERNPHRQQDPQRRLIPGEAHRGQHRGDVVHEEVEVLEEAEHAEVRDNAHPEERALVLRAGFHPPRRAVVDDRRRRDQDQEPRVNVAVEKVAAREQEDVLETVRQPPVDGREHQKEQDEIETVENHCAAGAPLTRGAGLNSTRRRS
jgi:hypothetical protein